MATSSITHKFVITDKKSAERFVKALEESKRDRTPRPLLPGRELTDPKEIKELVSEMLKRRQQPND